jgi:hypothetical protein
MLPARAQGRARALNPPYFFGIMCVRSIRPSLRHSLIPTNNLTDVIPGHLTQGDQLSGRLKPQMPGRVGMDGCI